MPWPPPGDLSDSRIKHMSPAFCLAGPAQRMPRALFPPAHPKPPGFCWRWSRSHGPSLSCSWVAGSEHSSQKDTGRVCSSFQVNGTPPQVGLVILISCWLAVQFCDHKGHKQAGAAGDRRSLAPDHSAHQLRTSCCCRQTSMCLRSLRPRGSSAVTSEDVGSSS